MDQLSVNRDHADIQSDQTPQQEKVSVDSDQQSLLTEADYERSGYDTMRHDKKSNIAICENLDEISDANIKEAVLFVHEGENSDTFYNFRGSMQTKHAARLSAYWYAYKTLLSPTYRVINLLVCTFILLLAVIENPSLVTEAQLPKDTKKAVVVVHALLEVFCLLYFGFDLLLRLLRLGCRSFFKHKRTMLILLVLVVMIVEAIAVLARQTHHFRITRALRPIFLMDTYYMGGVRRVLRQIFQCIKPMLDVLILLMLFLVLFSLLGFLIFADIDTTYFLSFSRSLVSLFITLTTANNPDVFMEAFTRHPASPIFFAAYIIIMVYLISNVGDFLLVRGKIALQN